MLDGYSYPLRPKFCHYSQKTLEEILWLLSNSDASLDSIAKYFDLTKGNISQINLGKIHRTNKDYPIRKESGRPKDRQEILAFLFKKESEENVNAN